MDPILVIFLVVIGSPALGYLLLKQQRLGFFTTAAALATLLTSVYLLLHFNNLLVEGEEGDYYFISFCFLFYVFLVFQALRIRQQTWRGLLFGLGAVSFAPVVLWTILITISYLVYY